MKSSQESVECQFTQFNDPKRIRPALDLNEHIGRVSYQRQLTMINKEKLSND